MTEQTEGKIQADCYKWFHNTYPEYRGLLYHNFNNPRNRVQGARMVAMGLIKGVADLSFLWNKTIYFIEIKTPEGKQKAHQIKWEELVTSYGFNYYIIRDKEEFKKLITEIIKQ